MKHLKAAGLGLGLLIVGLATPASAGQASGAPASCYKYSDGSGYCSGTFRGFRNAVGSSYAQFLAYPTTLLAFYGRYGTTSYSCYRGVSSGDDIGVHMVERWPMAAAPDTYFEIDWDSGGTCNYFVTGTRSDYLP